METPTRGQPNRREQQLPPGHNPPPVAAPAFGKCLKNHAVSTGGHALDGCREFMPTPTSTPTDLTSLICNACGCHRNFHHREVDQSQSPVERFDVIPHPYQPHHHPPPPPPPPPPPSLLVDMANSSGGTPDSPSPPPISSSYYPAPPHMFFAFNPGFPAPEPADKNLPSNLTTGSSQVRKKRFRSKFSQYQKTKMQEFAERLGWKMPKREEETIVGFCNEIGVDKGVFKVWMHNHKNINIRDNNHQNHREEGSNANGANGSSSFS